MREPLSLIDIVDAFARVSRHDVGLDSLFAVVVFERREMLGGKAAAFRIDVQRHGRAEHGQSLAQSHHLLFVQPQKRAVHQL